MGQVISAGILLVVVVAIYIAVSYKHEKSGLGKGCDGNCGSCRQIRNSTLRRIE